jgi:8-oxo-dGTP diphosphatase
MGRSEQGVQESAGRYTVIPRVLVFVLNGDDVLLLKGAPDKRIWADRYNGVGGHVEPDEDVYAAALRETREETGLEVYDLRFEGLVNIDVGSPTGIMLAVFSARSKARETIPSAEGTLEWVSLDRLGEVDLVQDIPVLLSRIVDRSAEGSPFFARYWYTDHGAGAGAGEQLQIDFARSA